MVEVKPLLADLPINVMRIKIRKADRQRVVEFGYYEKPTDTNLFVGLQGVR